MNEGTKVRVRRVGGKQGGPATAFIAASAGRVMLGDDGGKGWGVPLMLWKQAACRALSRVVTRSA